LSTVEYTHAESLDSSAIDEALYNENTRELTLDLNGNYYRYPNVPKHVWEALLEAPSAGRFYRETVKKNYGPAESLGSLNWDEFNEVKIEDKTTENVIHVPANRWGGYAVGTPKDLKVTDDTVVTTTTNVFNLTAAAPSADVRKHAVTFEVNGVRRTHNLKAESVDEAVQAVNDIADMLSLTFVVKEVTVYFD